MQGKTFPRNDVAANEFIKAISPREKRRASSFRLGVLFGRTTLYPFFTSPPTPKPLPSTQPRHLSLFSPLATDAANNKVSLVVRQRVDRF